MKSNKSKILALVLIAVLSQGTSTYASSSDEGYDKKELENLTPGWSGAIDKSQYKVKSDTNTFSSTQVEDKDKEKEEDDSTTTSTTPTNTIESNTGNVPVSTSPSTGNKGDFWGKTSDGKWLLFEQGVPVRGWRMVSGKWYYMNPEGVMQTGWVNYNDAWYYLNSGGDMAYNTWVNGYYVDWNGAWQ